MVYREEVLPWDKSEVNAQAENEARQNEEIPHSDKKVITPERKEVENDIPADFKTVEISPGSTLEEIAKLLEDHGLVGSREKFVGLVQELGLSHKIRADFYSIRIGADYREILQTITGGTFQMNDVNTGIQ